MVYGRKRWVLVSPGKTQNTKELPGGKGVPAYKWFQDSFPLWKRDFGEHLVEFYQEEGEVVYVPDNWGHALLNVEPCIGVSKQLGTFQWKEGVPQPIVDLL